MINKDEYIEVNYIDFLTVCDEHGKEYAVIGFKDAKFIDDLVYLEIILKDKETVKVVIDKGEYELLELEEDLLK